MAKSILTFLFIFSSHLFFGQNKVTGKLIDPYGNIGFATISSDFGNVDFDFDSGFFTITTEPKQKIEISITLPGYFDQKYIVGVHKKTTELGNVYLIENRNWLDGPKNGFLFGYSESGIIEYKRKIKNSKLNGISEFYDKKGKLVQKAIFRKNRPLKIIVSKNDEMVELDFEFDKKTKIITVPNN